MTVVLLVLVAAGVMALAGSLLMHAARRDERAVLLADLRRQTAEKQAARRAALLRWREARRGPRPGPVPAGAPAPTTPAAVALQGVRTPVAEPSEPAEA
jgi:hypothetical protein